MLTIADGRTSFYQWDIGQGLTVTPGEGETITEVHIGLNGCKKYFVVEPVDGVVAVYDELLQQGDTFLVAYEYVKTADDGHTINKYVFEIIGRPKATDYAYTPTESHSWEWWCNKAKSYAEAAAESANQAETAAASADASAGRAEAKADSIKNMTVSAHAEEGTEPTVTKTEEGGTFNLDFGLVRGEEGPEGPQGEPGPKGEDGRVTFEDVEPLLITDTASGAIASFPDGSGLDFISLKANINPIQDLSHGAPSPENLCPISGWDSAEAVKAGKNLFDPQKAIADSNNVNTYIENDWIRFRTGADRLRYYKKINGAASFSAVVKSATTSSNRITFTAFYSDGTSNMIIDVTTADTSEHFISGTTNSNKTLVELRSGYTDGAVTYIKDVQLELGSTATAYEPYQGTTHTATFDETVYGGEYDFVSGVLNKKPYFASYNGETLVGEWISDRDEYVAGTTPTIGAQVVNVGADGTDIQLSPQTITTLVGENNVWADSGDSEAEYYANAKLYIDKKLGELS